ncbi:SFRS16 [Mytilus coruscus]|uniref:SFRS16 n=1 Tax=Mytilus coruscus TaxID=42192 RepID=A0A6J8BB80_MYTCO|nr:SFRS16 [Mytilus coruscus]
MLGDVLPHLNRLSKIFQKTSVDFTLVDPMVSSTQMTLLRLLENPADNMTNLPTRFQQLEEYGVKGSETDITSFKERIYHQYINNVVENLHQRFPNTNILDALSVFDPDLIDKEDPSLHEWVQHQKLKTLSDHFTSVGSFEMVKTEFHSLRQLMAVSMKDLSLRDALHKVIQMSDLYPALAKYSMIALVLPVSTADYIYNHVARSKKTRKKIRGLMVDYKKRAERRREFYEKIKLDPAQFVRAYGRPCKINLDPAVAYAAESPQSMMPWQGQEDNMIDRFDVRAHLDYMPQTKIVAPPTLSKREEEEERSINYERYRIIVENECAGLTEEQALYQIYIDEQFGNVDKSKDEEKKKLEGKKAAIAFVYEDSTPILKDDEDSESSDTDVEDVDLDITLDVDTLNNEQKRLLNECAQQYGMKDDDFVSMLQKDKEEAEAMKLARILEEEKAQFAGRKSRRERRAYKEKRLAGRKLSPPSYAARDSPKYEPYQRSSSSSKSRSRSPERKDKLLFITSFGGDSDEERTVQGPSLPNTDKIDKWDKKAKKKKDKKKYRRSRSRSPSSRSRSRDHRERVKVKKATVRSRKEKEKHKRSYSRSSSHSSYSSKSSRNSSSHSRSRSVSRSKSRSRSRSRSRSYSSRSSSYDSKSRSRSPQKPVVAPPIKRYRRESLSSKSSESESDHRFLCLHTQSNSSQKHQSISKIDRSKIETKIPGKSASLNLQAKLTPQEKLKRKMQAALNKSFKADKKAEVERTIKSEQERLDREEELRIRALEMRRREREKRHRDRGDSSSDDSRSRSRSPDSVPSPAGSGSKRRKRSQSRSRSRERTSRFTDHR